MSAKFDGFSSWTKGMINWNVLDYCEGDNEQNVTVNIYLEYII